MTSPRIVVGIGAYNEAEYLDETIPAVLAQTMPDFALLILDNGSTDATWPILMKYAGQDARITLTHSPVNLSPPVAANRGWRLAIERYPETRWIVGHGADDLMAPDYLATILSTAEANPDANLIYSPWQWIDHPEKGVKVFPRFDPETCHQAHQVPAWHAFTRELWTSVGPQDEGIRIGADWEWIVRGRHAIKPVQLDRPYLSLRVRTGARKSQSDEVDWHALHHRLCEVAGKPAPAWAKPGALC